MFDFIEDISTTGKVVIATTVGLGIATLVSRHFDKKSVEELHAAADEENGTEQVVDPTVPLGTPAPQI